jgi:ABC-type glycerol-3-phosphate transport system permease component
MSETDVTAGGTVPERDNMRLYAGAIVAEIVVLVAIWLFQRYFGS